MAEKVCFADRRRPLLPQPLDKDCNYEFCQRLVRLRAAQLRPFTREADNKKKGPAHVDAEPFYRRPATSQDILGHILIFKPR